MLWFLFIHRVNLSPFTKDYRGEEHLNELDSIFGTPSKDGVNNNKSRFFKKKQVIYLVGGTVSGASQTKALDSELFSSYYRRVL